MSKKPAAQKPIPAPETPAPKTYLPWPVKEKELSQTPRSFRVERLNSFEWQAFVIDQNGEHTIGKPDLLDIIKNRIGMVLRAEGQLKFMAAKNKSVEPKNET